MFSSDHNQAVPLYSTVTRIVSRTFKDTEIALFDIPSAPENAEEYLGIAIYGSVPEDEVWKVVKRWYDANGNLKRQAYRSDIAWSERTHDWPGDGTRAFATVTWIDPTIPVTFNIFENDMYPEDYGWTGSNTENELCLGMANWVNAYFSGSGIATVVDNILTIKAVAVGTAGNAFAAFGSNPDGAIASGQFTGGTEPWA